MTLVLVRGDFYRLNESDVAFVNRYRGQGESLDETIERLWTEHEYECTNPGQCDTPNAHRDQKLTKKISNFNPNTLDYYLTVMMR